IEPASDHVKLHRERPAKVTLSNQRGAINGGVEVFALTGTSRQLPNRLLPGPGDSFAIVDLRSVGVRPVDIGEGEFGVQFAINTFGERAHPNYPAEFDIYIDADRDGVDDFLVFNSEMGGFAASGQNVVSVEDLVTKVITPVFFTDADFNSANAILTAPLAAVGLTLDTRFNFRVEAVDNYFTGLTTDSIDGMTCTLDLPKFVGSGIPDSGVPAGGSRALVITAVPGGERGSPSQTGLLLMYRDGRQGQEADTIDVDKVPKGRGKHSD